MMPLMVNHCMLGDGDGDGRCRHGIYHPQVKPMFPQSEAGREHQALALSGPASALSTTFNLRDSSE